MHACMQVRDWARRWSRDEAVCTCMRIIKLWATAKSIHSPLTGGLNSMGYMVMLLALAGEPPVDTATRTQAGEPSLDRKMPPQPQMHGNGFVDYVESETDVGKREALEIVQYHHPCGGEHACRDAPSDGRDTAAAGTPSLHCDDACSHSAGWSKDTNTCAHKDHMMPACEHGDTMSGTQQPAAIGDAAAHDIADIKTSALCKQGMALLSVFFDHYAAHVRKNRGKKVIHAPGGAVRPNMVAEVDVVRLSEHAVDHQHRGVGTTLFVQVWLYV